MPHCNKKMLSFFLTTRCNLCCRYCYNAKERNAIEEKTIPLEIAYAAIDWYFKTNDSRHIRFYGPGEPTQEFEKMKQITEYAKSHQNGGERVTVEIQTNGDSCDPNCRMYGEITFVAIWDIAAGEELTIDYAFVDNEDYSFECHCGSPNCRHTITGYDWKIKELQDKYYPYFAQYLKDKIDAMK